MQPSDETESRLFVRAAGISSSSTSRSEEVSAFCCEEFPVTCCESRDNLFSSANLCRSTKISLILQAYDKNYSYAYAHFSLLLYREQPTRGRMISNKPQRCKSMKPLDGCGASIILLSSS